MLSRIIDILRIHRNERFAAVVAMLIACALNALNVYCYHAQFSQLSLNYRKLFVSKYHLSGFDPLTYEVVSDWWPAYNVYRHPLLAFFIYPFSVVDNWVMAFTGVNAVVIITALILVLCAFYSFIFLFRIMKGVVGLDNSVSLLLTILFFSFGYIMLSVMAPDHFVMSMAALLLTLWLGGEKLKRGSALNMWQTISLFVLTAGISLNNGLKIILAALVTRRKRFFELRYLLFSVIIPAALIWHFARWEYHHYVWPREMARKEARMKKAKQEKAKAIALAKLQANMADTQKKASEPLPKKTKKRKKRNVKPIMQGEFMQWTDISTPRWDTAIENLFGEALQFHQDKLLGDVYRGRPAIVRYRYAFNYIIEGITVLLFLLGVWYGRKKLFLWTAMSFFLMDFFLHFIAGFGIDEIYIMSPHYLYVVPIAIAFLLKSMKESGRLKIYKATIVTVSILAVYYLAWNSTLLVQYMLH